MGQDRLEEKGFTPSRKVLGSNSIVIISLPICILEQDALSALPTQLFQKSLTVALDKRVMLNEGLINPSRRQEKSEHLSQWRCGSPPH